jgi:7-cyano-7-deazaguanine synthase in queuosine biosynthesis
MKTKIKVHIPVYEVYKKTKKENKKVILELSAFLSSYKGITKAEAKIDVDFNDLLPFVNLASNVVVDFFFLTASIYGIDRFIERRKNSVDGWSRNMEIEFPVRDLSIWNNKKDEIEKMLSFLTGDYWSISFYQAEFSFPKDPMKNEFSGSFSQVNLFSGGLDSLIGALDHLKSKPSERIILVSHYDRKMAKPHKDQRDLLNLINPIYKDQYIQVPSINVSLEKSTIKTETTLRSRSFLFSGMALLIAQSKSVSNIIVPENGSVSLNFPLSSSRRSACSTRTTHPTVLSFLSEIWRELGLTTSINNPYEFKTKGEMVSECKDQTNLLNMLGISNSCGKRGHRAHWDLGSKTASHCAVCMPCVYRRAAVINFDDKTTYGNNLNNLDFKKKKGQDIGALLNFLKKPLTIKEIRNELIVNGIKDLEKLDEYADLVDRTRLELKEYINKLGNTELKKKAGL